MSTIEDLRDQAFRLSTEERARLAHELTLTLDQSRDPTAREAWTTELRRRLESVQDGSATLEDWDTVQTRIKARLAGS